MKTFFLLGTLLTLTGCTAISPRVEKGAIEPHVNTSIPIRTIIEEPKAELTINNTSPIITSPLGTFTISPEAFRWILNQNSPLITLPEGAVKVNASVAPTILFPAGVVAKDSINITITLQPGSIVNNINVDTTANTSLFGKKEH